MIRGFLAAEPGEELVEVVDDRHAGTAVQATSPVSDAGRRRYATERHRFSDRTPRSPPTTALRRPRGSTNSSSLPALTRQSASGDVIGQAAVRLGDERACARCRPARSARTVSIVSVCEFPDENVVQIDAVGADQSRRERGGLQCRALLVLRRVQIPEREDQAGEAESVPVARRSALPSSGLLLVGRGRVADRPANRRHRS